MLCVGSLKQLFAVGGVGRGDAGFGRILLECEKIGPVVPKFVCFGECVDAAAE